MHSQNQKNRKSARNIPFEIQSEIIRRVLPVKSLLRFRSVSKRWKSLIDSSEFVRDHSVNQAHQHHILVRYQVAVDSYYKYVSIVDDDDSFPQNKSSPVVSRIVKRVDHGLMLDSSHGLVCLYGDSVRGEKLIVIWNPSIRKSVGIRLPLDITALGFGVCPKTNSPKIVIITPTNQIEPPVTLQAEVFTLSSRSWRSISMNMHFSSSTKFKSQQVVIDGIVHWAATSDSSNAYYDRIISFDLISEEFGEVDLPDSLAGRNLSISKINRSLVVLNPDDEFKTCEVWMRKNGFEKMFCVGITKIGEYEHYGVVGFRKNGQPIREEPCWDDDASMVTALEAYEPSTKHECDLGVYVDSFIAPFMITSYTQSLLLLNSRSDYIVQVHDDSRVLSDGSANIPFEIQSEIIKRVLPVKSLLRFRSVSKQWKSLIDSSEFINNHSVNQAHQHHILVRYQVAVDSYYKYVSIVDDDDSFPQNKSSPVVSRSLKRIDHGLMLDSSHGLVCLYGDHVRGGKMIVIWNPSIRKSVGIRLPLDITALGFGVCPQTNVPKIVMINPSNEIEPPVSLKAEVFTLSSRSWRSISMNMHFSSSTKFKSQQVVIDGVIHWATSDSSNVYFDHIVSFDLISEEFAEVDLPDSLGRRNLSISKTNKSLVVLNPDDEFKTCEVWMMMRKNRFEKMFSVDIQKIGEYELYGIVGFRKNGQPIREDPRWDDDASAVTALEAYEPSSKHMCDLGVYVDSYIAPFLITSYTESLLLLDNRPGDIVQ